MYSAKNVLFAFALIVKMQCFVISHITVRSINTDQIIEQFYDLPAQFGPNIPVDGLRVFAMQANPVHGCVLSPPPPFPKNNNMDNINLKYDMKFVLLIARNNCTFEEKVRNAQLSQYDAAIIYNIGSDGLEHMSAKDGGRDIKIPSVFVGESTGRYLTDSYASDLNFVLVLDDEMPFNINTHLILPFSILVGLSFIIMIVYVTYKCIMERRRVRQCRLPKKLLKKIPIIKFSEAHPYESCVICLEEYTKGERLRVLPCGHAYHCHCIDTWLTKNRRNCPMCKRKVFGRRLACNIRSRQISSDSTSSDTDDDTQPLLNVASNASTNHGTFININDNAPTEENTSTSTAPQQRINPFDRVPNLPENVANDLNVQQTRRSIWNFPFFRLFQRSSVEPDNAIETNPPTNSNDVSISVAVPTTSSNNILNANLSGSFKDDDITATIYEPSTSDNSNKNSNNNTVINENNRQSQVTHESSSLPRNYTINNSSDVFIQTPSQGGIGVAALPNTNLQRNQPMDRVNNRNDGNNRHRNMNI